MTVCKERPRLRLLTAHEIGERIEQVLGEPTEPAARSSGTDPSCPRWITAAELVRRVRPFLCRN